MLTQDAYNGIVAYFSKPGARLSRDGEPQSQCMYRAEDGRACAVGCLLPDNLISANLLAQNPSADTLLDEYTEIVEFFDAGPYLRNFLGEAQRAHDMADDVPHFLRDLRLIAVEYQLDITANAHKEG